MPRMIAGPLDNRLLIAAGFDDAVHEVGVTGGAFDEEFEVLLKTLHYIGARKTDNYGDFRLQDVRSWDRETWGAYWDIQRKFGRMEQQLSLFNDRTNPSPDTDDLQETLADMSVYCVRMIQILRRLEERKMVPK